eukprot:c19664_g1_i1.p1 GENE.c19664_g1_i1~~c19664_g1_i1.p1  ORF type:complete len:265 (+),score=72.62 c19664_g1_i1:719-1513(+)
MQDFNPRSIVDWGYYRERLASCIQKIITIPAALQRVDNPCPSVGHPDWLLKSLRKRDEQNTQHKITDMFKSHARKAIAAKLDSEKETAGKLVGEIGDLENIVTDKLNRGGRGRVVKYKRQSEKSKKSEDASGIDDVAITIQSNEGDDEQQNEPGNMEIDANSDQEIQNPIENENDQQLLEDDGHANSSEDEDDDEQEPDKNTASKVRNLDENLGGPDHSVEARARDVEICINGAFGSTSYGSDDGKRALHSGYAPGNAGNVHFM